MSWVIVDPVLMIVYGVFGTEVAAGEAVGQVHSSGEVWILPVRETRDEPDPTTHPNQSPAIHPNQMVIQDYVDVAVADFLPQSSK